jgi:hypothetical protein
MPISGLLLLAIVELGRVDPLFEELAVDLGFQSVTRSLSTGMSPRNRRTA